MILQNQPFLEKRVLDHYRLTTRRTINSKRNKKTYETGELLFPKRFSPLSSIRTRIKPEELVEVRILPRRSSFTIEIVYKKQIKPQPNLEEDKIVALDIGLNNLIAAVNNFGGDLIIISGKQVKWANQLMNKKIAELRAIQMVGKVPRKGDIMPETQEMRRIRRKRDKRVHDILHKASRYLIDFCLQNNVSTIVIGYNTQWKTGINLGKKSTGPSRTSANI